VRVETTSARSPFLCHVTDLLSEHYFTFSLQLFILLWEIRTTAAHQTLITWLECVCCAGNYECNNRSATCHKPDKNKQCIGLWSRAQTLLMIESISNRCCQAETNKTVCFRHNKRSTICLLDIFAHWKLINKLWFGFLQMLAIIYVYAYYS